MKVKKCQLNFEKPCADRGIICLKTANEKRAFNKKIEQMQKALEKMKFPDPQDLNQ